jgi:pimeloyl-ACP methyl ester carboxylesterase
MYLPRLHTAVDAFAMWTEDLRRRAPAPFRGGGCLPLDCFGPLPALPPPPGPAGPWRAASPRPAPGDGIMAVEAQPARGARRGTAILVPPWKLPRLSLLAGWAALLAHAGYDVWTLIPPRHLHRATPGTRSGEGFVSPDVPALRAAAEQLVLELRVLAALARPLGGEVALVGLSLGGVGAALAATAPERVDRVALVAPPADLAAVIAETRIGRRYMSLARRAGSLPPPAEAMSAMFEPFRADGRRPSARRLLVGVGSADRIAPPAGATALARAWGAELKVYPRGHLTLLFLCDALRADVARFLAT